MEFENEAVEVVLDDWDSIIKKACEQEKFNNREIISLIWARELLKSSIEE
jgi:hypothetical protein